jgi:hypothetical protein
VFSDLRLDLLYAWRASGPAGPQPCHRHDAGPGDRRQRGNRQRLQAVLLNPLPFRDPDRIVMACCCALRAGAAAEGMGRVDARPCPGRSGAEAQNDTPACT